MIVILWLCERMTLLWRQYSGVTYNAFSLLSNSPAGKREVRCVWEGIQKKTKNREKWIWKEIGETEWKVNFNGWSFFPMLMRWIVDFCMGHQLLFNVFWKYDQTGQVVNGQSSENLTFFYVFLNFTSIATFLKLAEMFHNLDLNDLPTLLRKLP